MMAAELDSKKKKKFSKKKRKRFLLYKIYRNIDIFYYLLDYFLQLSFSLSRAVSRGFERRIKQRTRHRMRRVILGILFLGVALVCFPGTVRAGSDLFFYLSEGKTKCFIEEVPKGTAILVKYNMVEGNKPVNMVVYNQKLEEIGRNTKMLVGGLYIMDHTDIILIEQKQEENMQSMHLLEVSTVFAWNLSQAPGPITTKP